MDPTPDIGVTGSDPTHLRSARTESDVVGTRGAYPWPIAARAVSQCIIASAVLLLRRRARLPRDQVGKRLQFADGSSAKVFRETIVDGARAEDPCLLVVKFRLRFLHGGWHRLFLWECILNTPLFVGFQGFCSKLWLDRDSSDNYRGLYEWSDPEHAEFYARSLWWVLRLVCQRDSIDYVILPGLNRDKIFSEPEALADFDSTSNAWWRVMGIVDAPSPLEDARQPKVEQFATQLAASLRDSRSGPRQEGLSIQDKGGCIGQHSTPVKDEDAN